MQWTSHCESSATELDSEDRNRMRVAPLNTRDRLRRCMAAISLTVISLPISMLAGPDRLTVSQSSQTIETYDFVEITLRASQPAAGNPFAGPTLQGQFAKVGTAEKT